MSMDNINQIWPAWHAVELIGRGAFGKVYKAKREELGEVFYSAVKVIQIPKDEDEIQEMLDEGHTSQSVRYYYESVAKGLMSEIKVLEVLKSAPNIVHIEDFVLREREETIGWEAYIRMELLENLDTWRKKCEMTSEDVVKLGIDLCTALEYCEQSKIIHRDIKPKNIFVDKYGTYKLGDFGIARQMEKTQSTLSQKGTELYMAPEVRFGTEKSSYNVDIYSLGLVMYRLLNKNKMPFEPTDKEFMTYRDREDALERRLKGEALIPPCGVDNVLGEIIKRACEFDKNKRYQGAKEMRAALIAYRDNKADVKEKYAETAAKYFKQQKDERGGEKTAKQPEQKNAQAALKKDAWITDEETMAAFASVKKAEAPWSAHRTEKGGAQSVYRFSFEKGKNKDKIEDKKENDEKKTKNDDSTKQTGEAKNTWESELDIIKPLTVFKAENMAGLTRTVNTGEKRYDVTIPTGECHGRRLRLNGEGRENTVTKQKGDLYLVMACDNLPETVSEITGYSGKTARTLCEWVYKPTEALFAQALKAREQGYYQEEMLYLMFIIEKEPENLEAWIKLGINRRVQGFLEDARRCYRHILTRDANYPFVYSNLGSLYMMEGDFKNAYCMFEKELQCAQKKVHVLPDGYYGFVYGNYAYAAGKAGDLKKAERLITMAEKNGYPNAKIVRKEFGLKKGFFSKRKK